MLLFSGYTAPNGKVIAVVGRIQKAKSVAQLG